MKTWIIPAVAVSLLLASPTAFAAPPEQNATSQQDRHKDKNANGNQSGHNDTNQNDGNRTNNTNQNTNQNTNVNRNINININRNVDINRHIDVKVYQRNLFSPHRYHWQTYRQPQGWYVHRWGYGQHLPRAWFVRDYWIPNFISFGLIAPPGGYVWVRVGEDALLVDTETGEVIRVVYGVFY